VPLPRAAVLARAATLLAAGAFLLVRAGEARRLAERPGTDAALLHRLAAVETALAALALLAVLALALAALRRGRRTGGGPTFRAPAGRPPAGGGESRHSSDSTQ